MSNWCEICIRSLNCTNINFPVLKLYYSDGKLDEGYMKALCTIFAISHKSIIISFKKN